MTATEIQVKIEQLIEIVRYSPSIKANIVASEIMRLKKRLREMETV